jgi:glycolate oxidase FAD binding subunit
MKMRPISAEEVAEAVRAHARVVPVGGRTKPAMIGEGDAIDLGALAGITEYESSEYTFTAKAGTSVEEVAGALRDKGQYLPFDPLLIKGGATLGGTVASGVSGPGRFRYGGLRDFLIGVQFVDGNGRLVRSGGKVVKNAAGFDLSKFMVGSLGRFGVMTELSFKVFPAPFEVVTLKITCPNHETAVDRLVEIASSRWEADALDYEAKTGALFVRLGGPGEALALLAKEVCARWPGECEQLEDLSVWAGVREATWASGSCLAKVALVPSLLVALEDRLAGLRTVERWYSSGCAVAWLSCEEAELGSLSRLLDELGLSGVLMRGPADGAPWLGRKQESGVAVAVKGALDPENRFPAIQSGQTI